MKRSEMVEKIYQELILWTNSYSKYKEIASPLKKELAGLLLNAIEEAGMLPPMQLKENGRPKEQTIPFVDYCIRQWEPEDE